MRLGEWRCGLTYLVGPGASDSGKLMNAATKLHILMACQQMPQTVVDVRTNAHQCVSAENHTRSTHTEVLLVLETQLSKFLLSTKTSLQAHKQHDSFWIHFYLGVDWSQCIVTVLVTCILEIFLITFPHSALSDRNGSYSQIFSCLL